VTLSYVLMQNLKRNRLRTSLTVVAFALPMAIFVLAISMVVALARTSSNLERELRLAVHSRITIINFLPDGYRRKIEELDPEHHLLRAVCGMRWFGGRVPDRPNALQSLAADADTLPIVYSEIGLTPDELDRWNHRKDAAIISPDLEEQYGWNVGDRVQLESSIPPYLKLDFTIIKIWAGSPFRTVFYFRRDYLVDSLERAGFPGAGCSIFWVKCVSAAALHELQGRIDSYFADTPDATKSEDENAFISGFITAIGDIPSLARAMALVVVCIIALVAGNTMMMSFRERTRELAVFKAIGFQSPRVFLIVLSESVMLALLGSLVGIVPVVAGLLVIPHKYLSYGAFAPPQPSLAAVAGSLAIGLVVGLAAGVWPAYQALRLRTTDALRTVA
jgi:putative ABC transport system permease protein